MVSKFSEIVKKEQQLWSLRKFLKVKLNCSQKEVQQLIEGGHVQIDGHKETFGSKKLKVSQRVQIEAPASLANISQTGAEQKVIEVIWEDDALLAVNKPTGLPSQKTKDSKRYSMEHWAERNYPKGLFLTHRLDRDTSGVLLFAKNKLMETRCFDWFKQRQVQKIYHAISYGKTKVGLEGEWLHHLGPDKLRGGRSCYKIVHAGGQKAETHYRVIKSNANYSLWELKPRTGRTHQLRVQLAQQNHPIVGDDLYDLNFRQRKPTPHHFLHARELHLPDSNGQKIIITAEYPLTWKAELKELNLL